MLKHEWAKFLFGRSILPFRSTRLLLFNGYITASLCFFSPTSYTTFSKVFKQEDLNVKTFLKINYLQKPFSYHIGERARVYTFFSYPLAQYPWTHGISNPFGVFSYYFLKSLVKVKHRSCLDKFSLIEPLYCWFDRAVKYIVGRGRDVESIRSSVIEPIKSTIQFGS